MAEIQENAQEKRRKTARQRKVQEKRALGNKEAHGITNKN